MRALAISPYEDYLASAHADGTLTIWDLRIPRLVRILSGHQGEVRGLTLTPDGRYLISGGYDETVRIWNTENGLEEKRLPMCGRDGEIIVSTAVAGQSSVLTFSCDGRHLACGTYNDTAFPAIM